MPVARSKQLEMTRRRQLVADLYVRGWNQVSIAQEVGVGQPTISTDLKAIRREWRESTVRDFDTARAVELRKLDRVEREAWAAWERSQEHAEWTKVTQDGQGKREEKTDQSRQQGRQVEPVHLAYSRVFIFCSPGQAQVHQCQLASLYWNFHTLAHLPRQGKNL